MLEGTAVGGLDPLVVKSMLKEEGRVSIEAEMVLVVNLSAVSVLVVLRASSRVLA